MSDTADMVTARHPDRTFRAVRKAPGRWTVEQVGGGYVELTHVAEDEWSLEADGGRTRVRAVLQLALEALPPWDVGWTDAIRDHVLAREGMLSPAAAAALEAAA